ncbi:MAG: hypothetical protein ACI9TP_002145, partial [Candidatus Azotimanducaceae bacterium]
MQFLEPNMRDNSQYFDQWIRGRFCALNSSLEA